LAEDLEDLLEVAAAVEVGYGDAGDVGELGAEAVDEAGDAELEEEKLVDLAVPVLAGPAAEGLPPMRPAL